MKVKYLHSTAPERKMLGSPSQDQHFCREEADLSAVCALWMCPGLGECPSDSYRQTLLSCDIIKISGSVSWGFRRWPTGWVFYSSHFLCVFHIVIDADLKASGFPKFPQFLVFLHMSPVCLSLQPGQVSLWNSSFLSLPTLLRLGTQSSK